MGTTGGAAVKVYSGRDASIDKSLKKGWEDEEPFGRLLPV